MKNYLLRYKYALTLSLLTIISICLFLFKLNWGSPYYFHPDERNIAFAVSGLRFPQQMNPHFFAYGSLPLYAIYFKGIMVNFLFLQKTPLQVNLNEAIIISRLFSAFFAASLIPLIFFLGAKIKNRQTGLLAACFSVFSPGLIQFAHFGTFEMWLTFLSILLFWLCLQYWQLPKTSLLFLSALAAGILTAIKISSLPLLLIPCVLIIMTSYQRLKKPKNIFGIIPGVLKKTVLFFLVASFVYFFTNPYVLFDHKEFFLSMHYETQVALGTLPVFYTGNFLNTIPVFYQFLKIYPFLLNPFQTVFFILSFCYLFWQAYKTKNHNYLLLITFYLLLFLPQAFFFVKWTRYILPTLPFVYLITAIAVFDFISTQKRFAKYILASIFLTSFLFAFSYFKTVFLNQDPRLEALAWAKTHLKKDSTITLEAFDLGSLPFQTFFPKAMIFDFYSMEKNASYPASTDYLILPSQRLIRTRLTNPQVFPKGYQFYHNLFQNKTTYRKIYQTPCDIFCKIIYLGDPINRFEETVNIFDHPTVFIFQKK